MNKCASPDAGRRLVLVNEKGNHEFSRISRTGRHDQQLHSLFLTAFAVRYGHKCRIYCCFDSKPLRLMSCDKNV